MGTLSFARGVLRIRTHSLESLANSVPMRLSPPLLNPDSMSSRRLILVFLRETQKSSTLTALFTHFPAFWQWAQCLINAMGVQVKYLER